MTLIVLVFIGAASWLTIASALVANWPPPQTKDTP